MNKYKLFNPIIGKHKGKEMDKDNERFSIWISFWKVFIGTFLISGATLIVNYSIQKKEIALKEMDILGKFVEHALKEDVGVRYRFAQYFSNVTRSTDIKKGWIDYFNVVAAEHKETTDKVASLKEQKKLPSLSALEKVQIQTTIENYEEQLKVKPNTFPRITINHNVDLRPTLLKKETTIKTILLPESAYKTDLITLDKQGILTIKPGFMWLKLVTNELGSSGVWDLYQGELFKPALAYSALLALQLNSEFQENHSEILDFIFIDLCTKEGINKRDAKYLYTLFSKNFLEHLSLYIFR